MAKVSPEERRRIARERTHSYTGGYRIKVPPSKANTGEATTQSGRQMKERLAVEEELGLRRGKAAFTKSKK